jgi:aldose 1-epimerase
LKTEGDAMTFKQGFAGVAVVLVSSLAQAASVTKADWGAAANGKPVQIYTLSDHDLKVSITTFGARVVSIEAPG